MIKALLIIITLDGAIFYKSMEDCWTVSKRLNQIQGAKVSICIPAEEFKKLQKKRSMLTL